MAEKVEIAARFGETVRELAETQAALEGEKRMRAKAEVRVRTMTAAMAAARAALDVTIDDDPNDPEDGAKIDGDDESARPAPAVETAENTTVPLSAAERDALDELAERSGFVDRTALIGALCRRAIADGAPRVPSRADPWGR
jgi:hypothetical protein